MQPPRPDSVEGKVLAFVNDQNRPLNAQYVADAFQKINIKKGPIQKALDVLSEGGLITGKDYNKQKIFLAKQEQFSIPSNEELDSMKKENEALQEQITAAKGVASELEKDIAGVESSLTLEEIQKRCLGLKEKNSVLAAKLDKFRSGTVVVDPKERQKVEQVFDNTITAWRKRKRAFKDLWSTFTEQMDKKQMQEFKEELGIEGDEEAGRSLDSFSHLVNRKRKASGMLRGGPQFKKEV